MSSFHEQRIRIALADDQPVLREGLRQLLSLQPDFKVVAEAEDGDKVIEMLREHEPDILLLDLKMPRLDGLSTLISIRTHKCRTKIIALTTSEDEGEHVQAMKYGAAGIVLMEKGMESLNEGIRKVHEGGVWLHKKALAAVMRQFGSPSKTPLGEHGRQPLTNRECQIVALVARGLKTKQLVDTLSVTPGTLKNHLHHIFKKLGVSGRLELARYAIEHNI